MLEFEERGKSEGSIMVGHVTLTFGFKGSHLATLISYQESKQMFYDYRGS